MKNESVFTKTVIASTRSKPVQKIGRYEIIEFLGQGAMALVYKAFDPAIDRTLAIKVLREEHCIDNEHRVRFLREAKAAGNLSHPNIVTVHDVGEFNKRPFIVMELLKGMPLDKLMESGKQFTFEETADIGIQLASALHYAHKNGVVHRDIKPSNIIFSSTSNNKPHVKITDFGIAHLTDENRTKHTQTGSVLGTPYNSSPEQVLGQKVDGRTDLFCLGITLYHLFAGQRPFNGAHLHTLLYQIATEDPRPITQVVPDFPVQLKDILEKLLRKQPDKRFQTGQDLALALTKALEDIKQRGAKRHTPRHIPMAVKATLVVATAMAVTLVASVSIFYQKQLGDLLEHLTELGIGYAGFSADQNAEPVLRGDWFALDLFVSQISKQQNINRLTIIDHQAIIRGDTQETVIGKRYKANGNTWTITENKQVTVRGENIDKPINILGISMPNYVRRGLRLDTLYVFSKPIVYRNRAVGKVIVSLSQGNIEHLALTSLVSITTPALICFFVVIAMVYLVTSKMAKPAQIIKSSIDEMAAGNYAWRITTDRADEMGEAFRSFNQMADKLQQRDVKQQTDSAL